MLKSRYSSITAVIIHTTHGKDLVLGLMFCKSVNVPKHQDISVKIIPRPRSNQIFSKGLPDTHGLLENQLSSEEAECCDVRWRSCDPPADSDYNASTKSADSELFYYHHNPSHHQHHHHRYHHLHHYHHHHHHPSLLPVSAGSRLSNSKLRLCVLVLMLLHTMASFSTVQNNGVSLEALPTLDENMTREE
uniref:Transmembrane protein FAM155B-like isoform X1 n=1 Tax=Geotrypetes seraphini TaxID=260995 RepID=A0A6P8QXY7_GEOSA|nr:transmembrane protein FAM155B-like isoform X1 [Geotrypetes seraphini]